MTIDEMIAVLTAAKEGKKIQSKRNNRAEWYENTCPVWNFEGFDYRVKPEPREWWIAGGFNPPYPSWVAYEKEHDAFLATRGFPGTFVKHVREVIDDK